MLAEKYIRYGGFGGIAYHHVSDLYILLFSHFVACGTWEAIYILDILMRNQSTIKPTTIRSDTQGQNLPVFGLAYLLCVPNGPYNKSQVARALGIGRATLYWPSKQAVKEKQVAVAIERWHEKDDTLGHRKLAALLQMGKNRVRRVMRK